MPASHAVGPYDVLGVGANSVDYVYLLPAYPVPEGPAAKLRISAHSQHCGGQVATTLCACAAMGLRTRYIGATGADDNGRRIRHEMTRRGVDLSGAVVRDVPNPFAVIMVHERSGDRIVLWDRDEGLALEPADLPPAIVQTARLVHVDDVDEMAALRTAHLARERAVPVTSDIDRFTGRTEELVAAVSIPMFADVPPALTGETDIERALRKLRRRHGGLLCVTLGARGAALLDGDRFHRQPAFAIEPVDTTGAGDDFRGAFIVALLRGDRT